MYKKDYILKLIEEFARALAKILKLKQEGENEKAIESIRITYDKILGTDYHLVHSSSTPELLKNLNNLSLDQLEMVGDLLKVEGEILIIQAKRDMAKELLEKVLYLFQHVDLNRSIYSLELQDQIKQVKDYLS